MIDFTAQLGAVAASDTVRKKAVEDLDSIEFQALLGGQVLHEELSLKLDTDLQEESSTFSQDQGAVPLPNSVKLEGAPLRKNMAESRAPETVNEQTLKLKELVDRFDRNILSMVQKNERIMKITLQPTAAGRMTILLREENSSLIVEVMTQTAGVRDLVADQEEAVKSIMEKHGVELGKFDVSLDEGGSEQGDFNENLPSSWKKACGIGTATSEDSEPEVLQMQYKGARVSLIA